VVNVASGYARNYLLPKRLAVPATDANRKIVEQERQAHLRREAKLKSEAEDLSKLVNGVVVTLSRKAGENDQLFGSVTVSDIAEALEGKNFTIDRRKVVLEEPIKQLGEYKVPVRLHREVTAELTVQVVKEEEPA
jgi:large subunit ribosomal protein L9